MINSAALQFCARKVAATTGDARKALDICRRAVEMLEIEKNKKTNVAGDFIEYLTLANRNSVVCLLYLSQFCFVFLSI